MAILKDCGSFDPGSIPGLGLFCINNEFANVC